MRVSELSFTEMRQRCGCVCNIAVDVSDDGDDANTKRHEGWASVILLGGEATPPIWLSSIQS